MSEDRALPRWCRRLGCGVLGVLSVVCFLLAVLQLATFPIEFLFHALVGWAPYLAKVVPNITWNAEIAACSLGALLLGVVGMRWLMPRLLAGRHWPWRCSFAWCGLLVLLFATSIAAIGVVHQVGWLFRSPRWIDDGPWSVSNRAGVSGQQLSGFARSYAWDHGGQLPEHYRQVIGGDMCFSRLERDDPEEPWIYLGAGLRSTDQDNLPVLVSPRSNRRGQRMLIRLDGSSELVSEDRFQAEIERLNERLAVSPQVR